jgi:hypothetical protein
MWEERYGIKVSLSTMSRAILLLGWTRKKLSGHDLCVTPNLPGWYLLHGMADGVYHLQAVAFPSRRRKSPLVSAVQQEGVAWQQREFTLS